MSDFPQRGGAFGLATGVAAYGIWGLVPLYFVLLAPTTPLEVVFWRAVLTLVVCVVLLSIARGWSGIRRAARSPAILKTTAAAAGLISLNWVAFAYGAMNGLVLDLSLGYFLVPIVTIALAVGLLRERLDAIQWTSVGISALGVAIMATGGRASPPWIALAVAVTFGLYSYVKSRLGKVISPLEGLTLESAWAVVPVSGALVVFLAWGGPLTMGNSGVAHSVLIALVGPLTAAPLLLFAVAAARLPLSVLGMLQYLAPLLQFAIGAFVLAEQIPPQRWVGFVLVWSALAILIIRSALLARRR